MEPYSSRKEHNIPENKRGYKDMIFEGLLAELFSKRLAPGGRNNIEE